MFMVLSSWHSHCKSSPSSSDECSTSAGQPPTFGRSQSARVTDPPKLAAIVQHLPSPFVTTQPKNWCSFYHPTEDRRLSRPGWLLAGYIRRWFARLQTVTHSCTKWAQCRVTMLIGHIHYTMPPTSSMMTMKSSGRRSEWRHSRDWPNIISNNNSDSTGVTTAKAEGTMCRLKVDAVTKTQLLEIFSTRHRVQWQKQTFQQLRHRLSTATSMGIFRTGTN